MLSVIKRCLRENNLLSNDNLDKIIEGIGFKINDYQFEGKRISNVSWEYTSTDENLKYYVTVDLLDKNIVISGRLKNVGKSKTLAIHILEPLNIIFDSPCDKWRHITLGGGMADGQYPPATYTKIDKTYTEGVRIESHTAGRSSNLYLPLLMSLFSEKDNSDGLYCGLEWSGLWYIELKKSEVQRSCLSAGIKVNGITLEPNETLELPNVHLGFFKDGPTGGSNALRKYIYNNISAKYNNKPVIPSVSYNHWQSELNFSSLKKQADRAAEIGVEVFIVDAEWFVGDFPYGVGNWDQINTDKFPEGLEPLAEYVRSFGMDFGLWFEPERAAENTTLTKQHPEWFFPGGEGTPYHPDGRGQGCHLNLAIPAVRAYLIEMIGSYIEKLDIRWIKWDYNIDPFQYWQNADRTLKVQFEYFKGLYEVLDTIIERYPKCRIEGCASGGRRIDLASIKRSHTLWLSDAYHYDHNPLLSRYIQARANFFLPGQLLLTWVSAKPAHHDKGVNETALLSRMAGQLGFNGDIASWSKKQSEKAAFWIKIYKEIRPLLLERFYQLLPMPTSIEDWDALQFINDSSTQSLLFVFCGNKAGSRNIKLRGLEAAQEYIVKNVVSGTEDSYTASELLNNGLPVELDEFGSGLRMISSKKVKANGLDWSKNSASGNLKL